MAQGKNPPLSGEFVSADPEGDISIWNARVRLLEAIERAHRPVIEALAFMVFPAYSALGPKAELSQYDQLTVEPSTPREIGRFKAVFDVWADKFRFEYEWMKDAAMRAMWVWYKNPGSVARLSWNPCEISPHFARSIVAAPPLKISIRGWSMETQTWASYTEAVQTELEGRLEAYKRHAQKLAALHGLVHAPRTYSSANFDWFVLSQFAGESPTKIAQRCALEGVKVGESTVRKGIAAARKLLGIDPRNRTKVDAPKPPPGIVDPIIEAIKEGAALRKFIDDGNASDIATGNVPMRWAGIRTVEKTTSPKILNRNRAALSALRRKSP